MAILQTRMRILQHIKSRKEIGMNAKEEKMKKKNKTATVCVCVSDVIKIVLAVAEEVAARMETNE